MEDRALARHPNKEIEAALQYAEDNGWQVIQASGGHNWGYMLCPHHARDGCRQAVYSTPRNPHKHAKLIRKAVDDCPH
jgi:2-oxoglutarate dehydrogenase complex dehydrogenase (E1) component-like enzyme